MAQQENNNQHSTSEVDRRIRDLTEQAIQAGADMKYTQLEIACLRSLFMEEPEKTVYAPPMDDGDGRQRPVAYVFPRPRRPTDSDTEYTAWTLKEQICRRLRLLPPVNPPPFRDPLPSYGSGIGLGPAARSRHLVTLLTGSQLRSSSTATPRMATPPQSHHAALVAPVVDSSPRTAWYMPEDYDTWE